MKSKLIIVLTIIAVILLAVATLGFIIANQQDQNSVKQTDNIFSFTKAVCTEGNFCQDVVVACKNKQVESVTPIQGAFAQFSPSWEDPRTKEQKEKLCE